MLAFHGRPDLKSEKLAQLRAHEAADEIIKGRYWEAGKGCAVGCTIHGSNHGAYETELGIPRLLAHLEDRIFEGMTNGAAKSFPVRFIDAIPVGADLSLVGWKFLHWLVGDVLERHGTDAVRTGCAAAMTVLEMKAAGTPVPYATADAARSAADATAYAARSAADAAAYAARSAADAAADAARSAADAARSAADAAARSAARSAADAAFNRQAEKLLELLAMAPLPEGLIAA